MHKGWERRSWKGQRAGRRKSQNKPRIAHSLPSRLMFLTERGFPRLAWGGCRLAPSRARGSPTPWASAIIPLAGPRPLGRSNLLGQEKETSGGGGGRTSVQGLRAAPRARLLAPFFFYIHRPAHAPTGAARAEVHPTGDPYRPRVARRKPRPIRALARECARARAQALLPPPIGSGGWAGRFYEGGGLGARRPGRRVGSACRSGPALKARVPGRRWVMPCSPQPLLALDAWNSFSRCAIFVFLVFTPPDRGGNCRQMRI